MTNESPPCREIDARNLEPPEPFVLAMEALDELRPGEMLKLLLLREPYPLYQVLDEHGYERATSVLADGAVEVRIRRAP